MQLLKLFSLVHSNISITAKLGVINSQFYRFLRLRRCKKFFVSQMVSLIVLLKNEGYPVKILWKRTRGLLNKGKFLCGIPAFGVLEYFEWFCIKSCKWGTSHKLTWSLFFPAVLFCGFLSILFCFSVFWISLWCCLLLVSSVAESSPRFWSCFRICSRNLVCRLVFSLAFTHCWELMKSVGKLWKWSHYHTC
jgi:hypothetical protein